jgi:hypothetical protein
MKLNFNNDPTIRALDMDRIVNRRQTPGKVHVDD